LFINWLLSSIRYQATYQYNMKFYFNNLNENNYILKVGLFYYSNSYAVCFRWYILAEQNNI